MPGKRIRKTGLPPGALIYTGVQKSDTVYKEYVRYNAEHIDQIELTPIPETQTNFFYWLDVRGIHNPAEIEALGKTFNIDPLLLEDILDPDQRPKFESSDTSIFLILKNLMPAEDSKEFRTEHISFHLSENRLITFQEYPDDTFHTIKLRMQQPTSRIRARRPDYLLYALIDFISDHYFPVLDQSSDRIHALETEVNTNPSEALKKSMYNIRQDLAALHQIILPTREAINALMRTDNVLLTEKTRRYLRDVMDNILQIIDLNDNQSDHLSSLHDLFMSEITYRMTNVMRILTVVTSIFIPLTFLTSIYGMNFKYLPELAWPWAYGALWVIMIIIAVAQVIYFKRKNWL